MADLKISQLTGASTPLAGTEVLPIVQSGATVKVSVANLTAGRAVGMAGGSFTDNITQSTAAKGVNFTANTPAAGMTSQLLNWYEEGTWTPTDASGAGLTFTTSKTLYTRVGNVVTVTGIVTWPATASGATAQVGGLPFTAKTGSTGFFPGVNNASLSIVGNVADGTATFYLGQPETTNNRTNANMSGKLFAFSGSYIAA